MANALARTDSFIEIAALVAAGHAPDDAARRAALVEPTLDDRDSAMALVRLGIDIGLLHESTDGTCHVSDDLGVTAAEVVPMNVDAAAIQVVLRDMMGPDGFRAVDQTERERLGLALQSVKLDPGRACEEAGKAVENFLRLVADDAGVDASRCNGIGELADVLASRTRAVIRPQHRAMAHLVAMARNASGHDRDKETLHSWEKTAAFAQATVLLAARLIASIQAWRGERGQVL